MAGKPECVEMIISNLALSCTVPWDDFAVVCIRESTKPILCSKWGHFDRAKPILRILLASWTLSTLEKGFRSFNSENLRSVGQRTAKLLAIKLYKWFDPGPSRIRAEGACTLFGRKGRLCIPLTYRPQILSIKRSKPFFNCLESWRG